MVLFFGKIKNTFPCINNLGLTRVGLPDEIMNPSLNFMLLAR